MIFCLNDITGRIYTLTYLQCVTTNISIHHKKLPRMLQIFSQIWAYDSQPFILWGPPPLLLTPFLKYCPLLLLSLSLPTSTPTAHLAEWLLTPCHKIIWIYICQTLVPEGPCYVIYAGTYNFLLVLWFDNTRTEPYKTQSRTHIYVCIYMYICTLEKLFCFKKMNHGLNDWVMKTLMFPWDASTEQKFAI